MENRKLSTGLQVWLWIIFVVNILSLIATFAGAAAFLALGIPLLSVLTIVAGILSLVIVVAVALMLFGKKKAGLYVLIGVCIIAFINNIIISVITTTFGPATLVKYVISAVICPLITYALAKKDIEAGILK